MSGRKQKYVDLVQKICFLIEDSVPRRVSGHKGTFSSFAETVGIDRKTLGEAIGGPDDEFGPYSDGNEKLTPETATKIAVTCDFPPNLAKCWDRCTFQKFKDLYLAQHGDDPATFEPSIPLPLFHRRVTEKYFFDDQLATIELCASQAGPEGTWPISFDLICNPSPVAGMKIAIRAGRVKMSCDGDVVSCMTNVASQPNVYRLESGEVTLTRGGRMRKGKPSWEVETANGPIGAVLLPYNSVR